MFDGDDHPAGRAWAAGLLAGLAVLVEYLPFLALGLAQVWSSVPQVLRRLVLVVSTCSMVLPSVTEHLMGDGSVLLVEHLGRLLRGGPEHTLLTMALGPVGWIPHILAVGLVLRRHRSHVQIDREGGVGRAPVDRVDAAPPASA